MVDLAGTLNILARAAIGPSEADPALLGLIHNALSDHRQKPLTT
jgi:hypothetical protein